MASVNKAIVIGYLGSDPETTTNGDVVVANFRVATNQQWTDRNGEQQQRTEWHNVTAWRRHAEIVRDYLHKGSLVYIEGYLRTDAWDGKCGQKHYRTSIVVQVLQMLDRTHGAQDAAEEATASPTETPVALDPQPVDEPQAEVATVTAGVQASVSDTDVQAPKRRTATAR